MTRPNFVEAEAIQRVVQWCEATGGKLYIVHMFCVLFKIDPMHI